MCLTKLSHLKPPFSYHSFLLAICKAASLKIKHYFWQVELALTSTVFSLGQRRAQKHVAAAFFMCSLYSLKRFWAYLISVTSLEHTTLSPFGKCTNWRVERCSQSQASARQNPLIVPGSFLDKADLDLSRALNREVLRLACPSHYAHPLYSAWGQAWRRETSTSPLGLKVIVSAWAFMKGHRGKTLMDK